MAGKRIVLTADRSLMTNYRGNFLYGFIACGPYEVLPEWVFDKVFCPPVETDPNTGEAKVAQVGLRRVEGALLQGYKRDEILTVNPDYIEKSIGSDTKIVGINVMDPLGMAPVTTTMSPEKLSYVAMKFKKMCADIIQLKKKYDFKVVVGGNGALGLFVTLGVVFLAASALGLNFMDSLFIAAALSISSTAIIVKILQDSGKIKKESSILILGILIVEDVIAVILIASLESVALAGTVSVEAVVLVAVVAGGLIVGTFTIGRRVIPPLIDKVAGAQNREILLLSVLGVCFGYALLANVVGLSVAIGAFLAGVLVAESKSSEVSKILSSPIKDMFVAIFFVSVGALMDVTQLEDYIFIAIALIAVTIAMKFGGNLLGTTAFRMGKGKSLRSAFALSAPRGEFSIVIVKVGVDMGVVSAFLFPLIGLITIITAFISPFLIRLGDRIIPKLSKS